MNLPVQRPTDLINDGSLLLGGLTWHASPTKAPIQFNKLFTGTARQDCEGLLQRRQCVFRFGQVPKTYDTDHYAKVQLVCQQPAW
jgi:hypothetical protein